MKDFYIVKKSVKRGVYKPKEKISFDEYREFIEKHSEFTWLEDTEHGKKWDKVRPVKRKLRAYLNYDINDEKSIVHLLISTGGYIHVRFDYKVTLKNLQDLLCLVGEIDCNLWQIKPKKIIVDDAYLEHFNSKA